MHTRSVLAGTSIVCALIFSLAGTSAGAVEQAVSLELLDAAPLPTASSEAAPDLAIYSPLPYDAAELEAAKAAAEAEIGGLAPDTAPQPLAAALAPTLVKGFAGQTDPTGSPPDTTSAVGNTRYIEPLNRVYKIWDKTPAVKGSGALADLFGVDPAINVFDPQVIWDPTTKRFYVTGDIVVDDANNYLAYSFSKTASPNNANDFCHYWLYYGASFPDYPKLGDTRDVVLIGVNTFGPTSFIGSDLISISKPANGDITTCPDPATFVVGVWQGLKTASGAVAFTPVPANQIDTAAAGYVVGRPASIPGAGATELVLWKVTSETDGTATLANINGSKVPVTAYKVPPNAPQPGTSAVIDTSDTRNTQAVSAKNPARGGKLSLWTQHTVLGGAGSEVRWYEINPAANALFAKGKLTNANVYYFNGAISPDRAVNGTTKKFGKSMVLQASASSSTLFPSIRAVSKIGNNAQSAVKVVKTGTQILNDFTCTPNCRWGDYAGLTPDPIAPAAATRGRVWGDNELGAGTSWKTWNFILKP